MMKWECATKEVPKEIKQLIQWYSNREHGKCRCQDPSCSGIQPLAKHLENINSKITDRKSDFDDLLRTMCQEGHSIQEGQQQNTLADKQKPIDLSLHLWKQRIIKTRSSSPGTLCNAETKKTLKEYPYFFGPPNTLEPSEDSNDTSVNIGECTCYVGRKESHGTQYSVTHFNIFTRHAKSSPRSATKGKVESSDANTMNQTVQNSSSTKLQQTSSTLDERCLQSVWKDQIQANTMVINEERDRQLDQDNNNLKSSGLNENSESVSQTAAKTFEQGMYMYKWQKVNEQRKQRKKRKTLEQLQAVWKILCFDGEDYPMENRNLLLLAKRPEEPQIEGANSQVKKVATASTQTRWNKSAQYFDDVPGPGYYNMAPWPSKVKQNKAPFNSTTARDREVICNAPPIGTYDIRLSEELGKPIQKHNTWGGPQTIKMATMIRCSEEPYDWCVVCQLQPKGDYYYSESLGPLCRKCYKTERSNQKHFNNLQIETFKAARHCGFMHFHDAHYNIFTTKNVKDIRNEISREAYLARYQVASLAKERLLSHPERARWFSDRSKYLKSVPILPKMPEEIKKTKWCDFGASKSTTGLGLGKPPPSWDILELKASVAEANNFAAEMIDAMRVESEDEGKDEIEDETSRKPAAGDLDNIKKWRIHRYGNMAKYYNAFLPDFYLPTPPDKLNPRKRNYQLAPKPKGMKSSMFVFEDPNKKVSESKRETCEEKMKKYLKKYKKKLIDDLMGGNLISRPDLHGLTIEEIIDLVHALPQTNEMYTNLPNSNDMKSDYCVPCDYLGGCRGAAQYCPKSN